MYVTGFERAERYAPGAGIALGELFGRGEPVAGECDLGSAGGLKAEGDGAVGVDFWGEDGWCGAAALCEGS